MIVVWARAELSLKAAWCAECTLINKQKLLLNAASLNEWRQRQLLMGKSHCLHLNCLGLHNSAQKFLASVAIYGSLDFVSCHEASCPPDQLTASNRLAKTKLDVLDPTKRVVGNKRWLFMSQSILNCCYLRLPGMLTRKDNSCWLGLGCSLAIDEFLQNSTFVTIAVNSRQLRTERRHSKT